MTGGFTDAIAPGADAVQVDVPSTDGVTALPGYLGRPAASGSVPTVVLLRGRRGLYSEAACDAERFDAAGLDARHTMWATFWQQRGYGALLVDSFARRGYSKGFEKDSYASRPPEVSENTVRLLDAYGAATWLRSQSFVAARRIALHGWSNGVMATLWAMWPKTRAAIGLGPK